MKNITQADLFPNLNYIKNYDIEQLTLDIRETLSFRGLGRQIMVIGIFHKYSTSTLNL